MPYNIDPLLNSLPPIVYPDTRLLILGSLPGRQSLAAQAYYAHPRNHFWQIMAYLTADSDLYLRDYATRLACLRRNHIGLWDVVGQAWRQGSLDQNLRNIRPNSLAQLLAQLPQLRAVAFNGQTAARLGKKQLLPQVLSFVLPSTSPAYTAPFTTKLAAWRVVESVLQA